MIGNDIVDLNVARLQSNWQRKGFLEKVFTPKEQEVIRNSSDSFTMVWWLWSMKESAYKIYSQQNRIRFFAPTKFECDCENLQQSVSIHDLRYYTKTTITSSRIHTIATLNLDKQYTSDCFKLSASTYNVQHNTTHNYLRSEISNQFHIPITELKIEKDVNGIPYVNQSQIASVTMAHHGNYGAYAYIS